MRKNLSMILVLCTVCLSFLSLGCERGITEEELARVNDTSISLEDFYQIAERQPLDKKMRLLTEKDQRDFLDNYVINREILYQEAKEKGLDKEPEILMKVEDFRKNMIIDTLVEEVLRGKSEVSDDEIEKYYRENQRGFTEPKEVKIRQIVVNSDSVLKEVLNRLSRGESFEKLAFLYNIDRFREDVGSFGYIRRGQVAPMFAQFEEAAFSLKKKGDISEVVRTPYGYHLLQLEDRRGTALRPLDQVKEKIRTFLQTKKKQDAYLAYLKEARSKAKITINEKLWAEEHEMEMKLEEEKK